MGGVGREQIDRAKRVDILDYILSHEPNNVKRVGKAHYLKDHDSLEISNGLWNWHSHGIGGKNVIDYLIKVRGYSFVDAVRLLAGDDPDSRASPKLKPSYKTISSDFNSVSERKPFSLPPRNINNMRVIAYLQSRGIAKPLILDCIERGSLYESRIYHNCVFVGRDEQGKARFAAMRGTLANYKRDADGSDKRFGFVIPPDSESDTVAVFESPIDALSHQTQSRAGQIEPFNGYRLSLGGTALSPLARFLDQHGEITSVVVCTDNDDAGNLAAAKIAELPGITVTRSKPPAGSDWNENLLAIQKAERLKHRGNRAISVESR